MEVSPDFNSTGTLMSFFISTEDLLNDELHLLPPQTLPGGRNLPGVSEGRLPAVAFSIEALNDTVFYANKNLFGIFLPLDIEYIWRFYYLSILCLWQKSR